MIIVDYNDIGTKRGLWQYDFGQVLRIQGGNLKPAVEIHFSLQETGGEAVTRIGTTKDGVTDVVIPDTMLINDDIDDKYNIYVFIYIADRESGETEKKFALEVKSRPKPEAFDATEDKELFEEAIRAVNESAERAETAEQQSAQHAEQTRQDTIKTGEDRTAIAEMVESVSGIGERVQAVKEYKEQAQTAATNALLSEQKSNEAKETALQAQAGAETAADEAEQHATEAAGDKSEVERLAAQVRQDKSSVEQTSQGFWSTVQQAEQSINTAKTKAVETVRTEGTTQTGNVTAEGEKQVQAVQAKGQQILDSIVDIQVNNPSTTYELQPNIQVVWGEVAELNITLAPEKPNAINIYPFWFISGATPTRVTLPATIILDNFVTKANKKYCCQIEQNVMFWKEFDVV
ncbi:MAG: hypothetical protein ACLUEC_02675 [Coprococcus sp.]